MGNDLVCYYDPTTEWTINIETHPQWGLLLTDVSHAGHFFAEWLRIHKIYVQSFSDDKGVKIEEAFSLGEQEKYGEVVITNLPNNATDPLGRYNPKLEISQEYIIRNVFGVEAQDLILKQKFLFTDFGSNPPHEPAGLLYAARVYPLLEIEVTNLKDIPAKQCIAAVRADFNFKFDIRGSHLDTSTNHENKVNDQQSGLWKDKDDVSVFSVTGDIIGTAILLNANSNNIFMPDVQRLQHILESRSSSGVFSKAEKPLLYEVVAAGVKNGKTADWDNYHQWKYLGKDKYPDSPGTLYALHMHWKWGSVYSHEKFEIAPKGGSIFSGAGNVPGGIMLDPNLPNQDITIAVITEETNNQIINSDKTTSFDKFEELFQTSATSMPKPIPEQADLVVWFSIIARRQEKKLFKGFLFAHGMFFAHQKTMPLLSAFKLTISGASQQQYIPNRPQQIWRR